MSMLIYKPLPSCQLCETNYYSICEITLKTIRKIEKVKFLVCIIIGHYLRKGHYLSKVVDLDSIESSNTKAGQLCSERYFFCIKICYHTGYYLPVFHI